MTFEILIQYMWIFFIAYNFFTVYKWRKYLLKNKLLSNQNELEFNELKKGYLLFSSLPWIFIGFYSMVTNFKFPLDLMSPYINPPAYWFAVLVSSTALLWEIFWIYFRGGAIKLSKYPGILDVKSTNPNTYKLLSLLGLVAIIGFLIMTHSIKAT